jgi:iron complex transport system substrate-binding protein
VSRISLTILVLALACSSVGRDATRPDRVVGVSKQLNEYMYAIGAESVLVARDLTSLQPAAIRALPSVGYHRALSAEGILSMKPTLVLTDGNVGPEAVLAQLRQVQVPILLVKPGNTVDSAQAAMVELGRRFHRERTADSVVAAWRAAMDRVLADSAQRATGRRPRVLLMHFGQMVNDYLAVNRGSPADRMIAWAGGVNAIDSVGGMTRLTPELIARAAPDVIIATDVGFDRLGSTARFAALPGVSLTPAARAGRIHRIDESEIMYFTPRTPSVIGQLAGWVGEGAAASDTTRAR